MKNVFCSLDIETTGFDPLCEEILELGFVFFEVTQKGVVFGKKYTQVFKPKKEVPAKIFALTGIDPKELETAPEFSEEKDNIEKQLKDAVIVGHNISFDIKFLTMAGVKLSGLSVDTLDLAQWLLPTHPSYNLENLAHLFGIVHTNAHRALADAEAAAHLINNLLGVFAGLPAKAKKEVRDCLQKQNFVWGQWFMQDLEAPPGLKIKKAAKPKKQIAGKDTLFSNKGFLVLPFGEDVAVYAAKHIVGSGSEAVLALKDDNEVLRLWKAGLAEPVFESREIFSNDKFESFISKDNLSPEQTRFALKIIVWKAVNWQNTALIDLNLTFSGGQFKAEVSGGSNSPKNANLLCCSHSALTGNIDQSLKSRKVLILGAKDFETALTEPTGSRVSWGQFNYLLRSLTQTEKTEKNFKMFSAVDKAQTAVDLFFGTVSAMLQTDPPGFVNVKFDAEFQTTETFSRILSAAENFQKKIKELNVELGQTKITELANSLREFFIENQNLVKWIELSEKRCVFASSPISIAQKANEIFDSFAGVALADSCKSQAVFQYFQTRFGLKLEYKEISVKSGFDLFSSANKKSRLQILKSMPNNQGLIGYLQQAKYPAAILFASQSGVKEFYEPNYEILKSLGRVLSSGGSGGGNKILRNFAIHKDSLLLATPKFLLQQIFNQHQKVLPQGLGVKTLFLLNLPFEQFTHPYQEAVAKLFQNSFTDYSIPRAIYNLQAILEFCCLSSSSEVYISDQKTEKAYFTPFFDYLNGIFEISKEK